jgi:tetratricopeptide (TPR) repeat protein
VGKANANLGITLLGRGEIDRGVLSMQRALQIFERVLGPNHPTVATVLVNLGSAHARRWDHVAAESTLRRGLAIREAALGPDHHDLPMALANLSRELRGQNKLDEALVLDRRGVAIVERAAGPDDILLLGPVLELGLVEARLGRFAEADGHLRHAIAIAGKALGNDHPDAMLPVTALGDSFLLQSRWADAARCYEQAIGVFQKQPGAREDLADAEVHLARVHVELHQPARALASLERLAAELDKRPPELRPMIELTLARALWDSGGDRQRACKLGHQALAHSKQALGVSRDEVAQIERWMSSHRGC